MRALLPAIVLLAAAITTGLRGQAPAGTVTMDVSAVDANGTPLRSLNAEDLRLRIDNRLHPIDALELVAYGGEAPTLPAPYATNQLARGRTIAMAVDVTRLPTTGAPAVKAQALSLIDALGDRDRVGLVALAMDGSTLDFTARHDLVRAAAERLAGVPVVAQGTKAEETAAVTSLELLERLCNSLASEPGSKRVAFFASPFATSSDVRRALQSLGVATGRHRIQLFIVGPDAAAIAPDGGLAALAAATGGVLTTSASTAVTATHYELRFTPTPDHRDDKPHRVQLLSVRPGAKVTSPPSVVIADAPETEALPALADMLRESRPYPDLPLRMAVYPVRDTGEDRLRLLALAEPEDVMRPLAWAEFALVTPSGAIVAQWKLDGADAAARPMVTVAVVPPGPYRLRMAASELSGRRGAVDYEFDARLTPAGTFELGPLMFGGMADQAFVPLLQPAADAEATMAYTEIYGAAAESDALSVRFEVARTADGEPLASAAGSVRTTADPARRAALGVVELAPLSPGDYLIRAIITLNDKEIGRVTRTLRKVSP
jgi:hypothetical protein